jgi:hypothetical protein
VAIGYNPTTTAEYMVLFITKSCNHLHKSLVHKFRSMTVTMTVTVTTTVVAVARAMEMGLGA